MSPKLKFLSLKFTLIVLLIAIGNFFWFKLLGDFKDAHLLTNSLIQVVLSFIFPIVILCLYLSILVISSIFIKNRWILFLAIYLSTATYPFLIGGSLSSTGGGILIAIALFYFLISFRKLTVLKRYKPSVIQTQSTAFSITSIVISVVLAVNFYNIYVKSLTSTNTLLSSQLLAKTLNPVVRIYMDDLHIKNPQEKISDYLKRESKAQKLTYDELKSKLMDKMKVTKIDENGPITNLVRDSLNGSVLKIAKEYDKQIPILISLGLGVIIQTIMTTAGFLSGYLTWFLLKILGLLKLSKINVKQIELTQPISAE